jgi:hypothetical protein
MRPDKEIARKHGIPPAIRRYAKRYGIEVDELLTTHKQFPAPMLDHWRDRNGGTRPFGVTDWVRA